MYQVDQQLKSGDNLGMGQLAVMVHSLVEAGRMIESAA